MNRYPFLKSGMLGLAIVSFLIAAGVVFTDFQAAKAVCGTGYSVQPGPQVETGEATDITATAATINGDLVSMGYPSTVFVSFVWGIGDEADCVADCDYTDCSAGNCGDSTSVQAMTSTGTFSVELSGLQPGTTYYFRAKADAGG